MDLVERLIAFIKQPEEGTRDQSPEGVCPVCWGHQEYDRKIRKMHKDKQIDVNNHKASYMLVQDFVVRYINGIKLREGVEEGCPTCGNDQDKSQDNRK